MTGNLGTIRLGTPIRRLYLEQVQMEADGVEAPLAGLFLAVGPLLVGVLLLGLRLAEDPRWAYHPSLVRLKSHRLSRLVRRRAKRRIM
jgi:hypothetical protein